LVATTLCTIASTALYADIARAVCGGSRRRLAYATAGLTALTLFFGELLPKAWGVNNAEPVARRAAPLIVALSRVLGPLGTGFSTLAKGVLRMAGLEVTDDEASVSAGELRLTVGGAATSGGIDTGEGTMIAGVLDLQETRVGEFMKPRVEVHALERGSSMADLLHLVKDTGHSRVPVYDEEIDRIVGVVNAKRLLAFLRRPIDAPEKSIADTDLAAYVEPTYFVPETMVAWKVLEEMRRRRLHMAIVVDEYGGTAGMVTLEDILELVVGDIYDEGDEAEVALGDDLEEMRPGTWELRGTAALDDVVIALGLRDEGGDLDVDAIPDVTTAAGFLCFHAGEIPAKGDHVIVHGYDFHVTDADDRKVTTIVASKLGDAPEEEDGGEDEGAEAEGDAKAHATAATAAAAAGT